MLCRVRRGGPDDFEVLKGLLREGDEYHRNLDAYGVRAERRDYTLEEYEKVLANPAMAVFIAEIAGKALGFLRATRIEYAGGRLHPERKFVQIDEIVVSDGARGVGLGTALLDQAKAWAVEQECSALELIVWTQNKQAIEFYKRKGFAEERLRLGLRIDQARAHRRIQGRLVIATHNAGKLREMRELLAPYGIEAVSAGELGLPEPAETGASFRENAGIKATAAAHATGDPAFADDSGLCVDALAGAPGIHSARWAGERKDFAHAMQKVEDALQACNAIAPSARKAHFTSALCVAWPDSHVEEFEGRVDGTLVWPPRGSAGFGYDPMFLPDEFDRTFGELTSEEKHWLPPRGLGLSHRARAFLKLAEACLERR
jgi:XTP/dITP diphosphohydrolase